MVGTSALGCTWLEDCTHAGEAAATDDGAQRLRRYVDGVFRNAGVRQNHEFAVVRDFEVQGHMYTCSVPGTDTRLTDRGGGAYALASLH
jgi:hypothetical protein